MKALAPPSVRWSSLDRDSPVAGECAAAPSPRSGSLVRCRTRSRSSCSSGSIGGVRVERVSRLRKRQEDRADISPDRRTLADRGRISVQLQLLDAFLSPDGVPFLSMSLVAATSLTPQVKTPIPGPYSSLMVLRRRASRSGAGRAVRGRKTQGSADTALIRLFISNKDSGTRRSAVHATVRSRYVS